MADVYPPRRYCAEAWDYFARLAAAGSGPGPNAAAIDTLFRGLVAAGLWPKLGAACLLAGPASLAGALVPIRADMPAPTAFNFVAGDHSRTAGPKGDGVSKYLLSGYNPVAMGDSLSSCALVAQTSGADAGGSRALMGSEDASAVNALALGRYASGTRNVGLIGISAGAEYSPSPGDGAQREGVWIVSCDGDRVQRFYADGVAVGGGVVASGAFADREIAVFAANSASAGVFLRTARRIGVYAVSAGLSPAEAVAVSALLSAYVAALR